MSSSPPTSPDSEFEDDVRNDAVIAKAFYLSVGVLVVIGLAIGAAMYLLRKAPPVITKVTEYTPAVGRQATDVTAPKIPFTEISEAAGLNFVHDNAALGEKLLPETMAGGVAFFDYDSDGDPDVIFTNCRHWPWDTRTVPQPTLALFENDGKGNFRNVTAEVGLDVSLFAMGVAVGDFNNDGTPDLFISELGRGHLFRNERVQKEGKTTTRFVDVTDDAGVAGKATDWGTSCGWFDFDRDGNLDLWVCHYVEWTREFDLAQDFTLTGNVRGYGRPQNFPGTFSTLYHNDGNGHLTDVSAEAGIQVLNPARKDPKSREASGKSLGLTFADVDDDGFLDVFVANDTVQNFFFHNQGNGTFRERGIESGVAYDDKGQARGAMGIDAACFRGPEAGMGVCIGNFANEETALYCNSHDNPLQFADEAISTGLGPETRLELTFGVLFLDLDLDGRLDYFAANGHLEQEIHKVQESQRYAQPPHLFWNAGALQKTEFIRLTAKECGNELFRPLVGRGAAYADIDGDGDLDLVIACVGERPRLYRNDQATGHHWARLQLRGRPGTQLDAIGARVTLKLSDERRLIQVVNPTKSYLSQSELPLTFGLGDATIESAEIRWPNGQIQHVLKLEADRLHQIVQPEATPPSAL